MRQDLGVAVTRVYASLVVQHERLTARAVTERLGLEPSESFELGDAFSQGTRSRTHSSWSLNSTLSRDGDDLEGHLRELVDRLLPLQEPLSSLASEGYRMDWWCFIGEDEGQGGVTLSDRLLRDLAVLPVSLALDIYAGQQPDE
jgi:hypothetical protein